MSTHDDELTKELRGTTKCAHTQPRETTAAAAVPTLDDHPHHRRLSEVELETEIDKGLRAADRGEFVDCTPNSIIAEANARRS